MSRLRPALAALTHLGITTTAGGLALATPVVIMGAAAFHNSVLKHLGLGTSVGNVVLAGSCLTLAAVAPACLGTAETHARRLKGTPAARFLRRAIPGAVASAALLFNAAAPGIGATINPFRPKSLQDYMVQAYHLYNQCSPNTPINPEAWKVEEPLLASIALAAMRADRQKTPGAPETPVLPAGPGPLAPPSQSPLLPCCGGENLAATLNRRGKRGSAVQAGFSSKPIL